MTKVVTMQDEQQFEQLMLQYKQLKNGAEDIRAMIDSEDYDGALTMIKSRESLFMSCKCMRKYLELTPVQQKELDELVDELRDLELTNIRTLEKAMDQVQMELKKSQKNEKIQQAYDFDEDKKGSIINISE